MCGRYAVTSAPELIARLFGTKGEVPNFPPHYNAAPTQELPVIRRHRRTGERRLDLLRWGLVPSWAKDIKIGYRTINARGETLETTRAFREAFKKRRCLVVADAFYEWQKLVGGKRKQPFAISMKQGGPFAFAGLWENWKDPVGHWVRTFTIVTTTPNELVAPIHDRMPAILGAEQYERWLGDEPAPQDLIAPFPAHAMTAWQVSARVNKPENDDPAVLEAGWGTRPQACRRHW